MLSAREYAAGTFLFMGHIMDRMRNLLTQICKFGLVGVICFGIDYALMIVMTELFHIMYLLSAAISFVVSVVVNYILSMRYVFHGKEDNSRLREMVVFVALSTVGLGLNQLTMWVSVEFFHVFYKLAKVIATFFVMVYNFISRKLVLEKRGHTTRGEESR